MKFLVFVSSLLLVLTQTPAHSQTSALVDNDSTQTRAIPLQQYDFYYSAQQADSFLKISIASYSYVLADRLKKSRFRYKTFTEVVDKGVSVKGRFDDYVLIGSGTINEIKPNGDW